VIDWSTKISHQRDNKLYKPAKVMIRV